MVSMLLIIYEFSRILVTIPVGIDTSCTVFLALFDYALIGVSVAVFYKAVLTVHIVMNKGTNKSRKILHYYFATPSGDTLFEITDEKERVLVFFWIRVENVDATTIHLIFDILAAINITIVFGWEIVNTKSISYVVFELPLVLKIDSIRRFGSLFALTMYIIRGVLNGFYPIVFAEKSLHFGINFLLDPIWHILTNVDLLINELLLVIFIYFFQKVNRVLEPKYLLVKHVARWFEFYHMSVSMFLTIIDLSAVYSQILLIQNYSIACKLEISRLVVFDLWDYHEAALIFIQNASLVK